MSSSQPSDSSQQMGTVSPAEAECPEELQPTSPRPGEMVAEARSPDGPDPAGLGISRQEVTGRAIQVSDPDTSKTELVEQFKNSVLQREALQDMVNAKQYGISGTGVWCVDDEVWHTEGEYTMRERELKERYKDRVAIVTGGARGIGEGISKEFARNGAKVVIFDIRVDEANTICQEITQSMSGTAEFVQCDMLKEEDIKSCIQQVADKHGRLDCVVNNAGWHPPATVIDDVTSDDYTSLFKLNQLAPLLMCKYSLPHLRKVHGNIINIASMAGVGGQKEATCYSACKGAIVAMTKSLAIDEGKNKVRVNAISPGAIKTPLMQEWANSFPNPEEKLAEAAKISLLDKVGTPEGVGKLALYIAADGDYVTGANHIISGGYELPRY